MKLESAASLAMGREQSAPEVLEELLPLEVGRDSATPFRFDPRPLMSHLYQRSGIEERSSLALLFHEAMASVVVRGAVLLRDRTGIELLCLSGGVFQNALLWKLAMPALERARFKVFRNQSVPAGDGGIAVGQAWYEGDGG